MCQVSIHGNILFPSALQAKKMCEVAGGCRLIGGGKDLNFREEALPFGNQAHSRATDGLENGRLRKQIEGKSYGNLGGNRIDAQKIIEGVNYMAALNGTNSRGAMGGGSAHLPQESSRVGDEDLQRLTQVNVISRWQPKKSGDALMDDSDQGVAADSAGKSNHQFERAYLHHLVAKLGNKCQNSSTLHEESGNV
ncbi:hypothetical protein AXF42_Ash000683 [Apostasia shenzhenica]|uniref:Uncharacterized protein n=1 Tax=Apostasia shenzhenica TaxID=1088818 RepID=A0A2I0AH35_9ASPA|nr:hypothetical protein AXF42_Ash000683 [Apostasia shenzhenica]